MSNVSNMMSSAGAMKMKKRQVDMHTNLAFALLNQVKERYVSAIPRVFVL